MCVSVLRAKETALCFVAVAEISGSDKNPTKTSAPFYDEEDEAVYGSAEYDKTENKSPTVDNTVHGHVGYPLVTPSSTIRVSKKRPTVNAVSSAGDPHPRGSLWYVVLSSLVPVITVCRRWWW